MKWTYVLLSIMLLTGCSRFSLSDLATGTGAVTGAAIASGVGAAPAVVALTTTGGAVAGSALVVEETPANDACLKNPDACAEIQTGETIRDFIHWIIGGAVLLIIAAWLIPGPQLTWRKRDADSNPTSHRTGSGRGD